MVNSKVYSLKCQLTSVRFIKSNFKSKVGDLILILVDFNLSLTFFNPL